MLDEVDVLSERCKFSNAPIAGPVDVAGDTVGLHGLFLAMASGVLLLSLIMNNDSGSKVFLPGIGTALPSMCSSKILLGMDCPGCGLTRAFIAISHGRFTQAWEFNRASFVVYAFVALQIPWHTSQILRLKSGREPSRPCWIYGVPIVLVLVLFVSWALKISEF